MVEAALFQVTVALGGLAFLLLFLDEMDAQEATKLQRKAVGALFLYTVSMFTLLIPATTRRTYTLFAIQIPPLYVLMEGFVLGFMISIVWEVFYG